MLHQAATGGISTLQRERSSEALVRDQVHENKACQSRNDDDYMRDKERTNTKKRSRRSVLRSGPVQSFFLFRKDQDQDRS